MRELIRRGVLAGIGALALARERGKAVMDDLVKRGETATREERLKFIDELLKRVEEEKRIVRERIGAELEKAAATLGVPTKRDFEELSKKIDELSKKVAAKG